MSAAPAATNVTESTLERRITVEEFEQMDFEFPVDLVRGRIEETPPPAPAHGRVCGNIYFLLESWVRSTGFGTVTCNDSAIVTDSALETVRGSDVAFIRWESLPDRVLPVKAFRVAPDLVVEVLSPSQQWSKVEEKLADYLGAGVKEVWVVTFEERSVWVCRADNGRRRLDETDELTSPELLPGFSCRVVDFFLHV
ncbi:MAG: Uma2 family endonuclease [Planctomycetaceae bacterium]|nr:Uma2 family endonuclease [Planctomycetaceae bacterium]